MTETKVFMASSIVEFTSERYHIGAMVHRLNQAMHTHGNRIRLYLCEDESNQVAPGRSQDVYNRFIATSDVFFMVIGAGLGRYTLEELAQAVEARVANCGTPRLIIAVSGSPERGNPVDRLTTAIASVADYEHARGAALSEGELEEIEANSKYILSHIDTIVETATCKYTEDFIDSFSNTSDLCDLLLAALLAGECHDVPASTSNGYVLTSAMSVAPSGPRTDEVLANNTRTDANCSSGVSFGTSVAITRVCVATDLELGEDARALEDFGRSLTDATSKECKATWIVALDDDSPVPRDADAELTTADYFYLLASDEKDGRAVGLFRKAVDLSRKVRQERRGLPRVYAYARGNSSGSVRETTEELGYYHGMYTSLDAIKYSLVIELARNHEGRDQLSIRNGELFLGGSRVLGLGMVPAYEGAISEIRDRLHDVDQRFRKARASFTSDTEDMVAYRNFVRLGEQRAKLRAEIAAAESSLLDLSVRLAALTVPKDKLLADWVNEARRLLEAGAYVNAIELLENEDMDSYSVLLDMEQAHDDEAHKARRRARREWQADYLDALLLRIYARESLGVVSKSFEVIKGDFERCLDIAKRWNLSLYFAPSYARLLAEHGQAKDGMEVALLAAQTAKQDADAADALSALATSLRMEGNLQEAEECCRIALEIYESLADNSTLYEPDLAATLHNLALCLTEGGRGADAEGLFRRALEIIRHLEEEKPGVYQAPLARTLDSLAFCVLGLGRSQEAEVLSRDSVRLYERLVKERPSVYEMKLACALVNHASIVVSLGHNADAEVTYRHALGIYERLAEEEPAAHEPELARTLYHLALCVKSLGRLEEAERFYRRALKVYERLGEVVPRKFEPLIAMSLYELAICRSAQGQSKEATNLLSRGLAIYERLAEKTPAAYEPNLAGTLHNLAVLFAESGNNAEAEELYRRALVLSKDLFYLFRAMRYHSVRRPTGGAAWRSTGSS